LYHVTANYCVDATYEIFEGILKLELTAALQYFIFDLKWFEISSQYTECQAKAFPLRICLRGRVVKVARRLASLHTT
jgi:hypothetical protein